MARSCRAWTSDGLRDRKISRIFLGEFKEHDRSMRVVLIYPDITYDEYRVASKWRGKFYSGVAYLSSVLKRAGHQCALLHVTHEVDAETFLERLDRLGAADLYGFSFTTQMYRFVKAYSPLVRKRHPTIPQICGGIFTTLNPRRVLEELPVDFACRGDGEIPLVQLCAALDAGGDLNGIPNIWRKNQGTIFETAFSNIAVDLDDIPFPDRELFDYPNLEYERNGMTSLIAGRGCPYGCAYCSNNYLKRLYQAGKNFIRYRSPANVVAEAETIRDAYPFVKELFFSDDILPLKLSWFRDFADLYASRVRLPYSCAIYPSLINDEVLSLLKKSGCKTLNVGLESGNENLRNKVLRRNLSDAMMRKAIDLCRAHDINLLTFNMVGLPGETLHSMMETVDLNAYAFRGSDRIAAAASIFYPYEQTELGDFCDANDLIASRDNTLNSHFQDSILKWDGGHHQLILAVQRNFHKLVEASLVKGPLSHWAEDDIRALLQRLDAPMTAVKAPLA